MKVYFDNLDKRRLLKDANFSNFYKFYTSTSRVGTSSLIYAVINSQRQNEDQDLARVPAHNYAGTSVKSGSNNNKKQTNFHQPTHTDRPPKPTQTTDQAIHTKDLAKNKEYITTDQSIHSTYKRPPDKKSRTDQSINRENGIYFTTPQSINRENGEYFTCREASRPSPSCLLKTGLQIAN